MQLSYFRKAFLLPTTIALCLAIGSVAMAAGISRDVRYSGLSLMTLTIDASQINSIALSGAGGALDTLGNTLVILGGESVSGERQGWIIGGFAGSGKLQGETQKAELTISLAGASMERTMHERGNLIIFICALAGVGHARLELEMANPQPTSWDDVRTVGHTNTVNSVFWFVQPALGARLILSENIAVEAKLGMGMSMTDGQWRQGQNALPNVSYKVSGPSLLLGVKVGVF